MQSEHVRSADHTQDLGHRALAGPATVLPCCSCCTRKPPLALPVRCTARCHHRRRAWHSMTAASCCHYFNCLNAPQAGLTHHAVTCSLADTTALPLLPLLLLSGLSGALQQQQQRHTHTCTYADHAQARLGQPGVTATPPEYMFAVDLGGMPPALRLRLLPRPSAWSKSSQSPSQQLHTALDLGTQLLRTRV